MEIIESRPNTGREGQSCAPPLVISYLGRDKWVLMDCFATTLIDMLMHNVFLALP